MPLIATFANKKRMRGVRRQHRLVVNGFMTLVLLALDRVVITANTLHRSQNRFDDTGCWQGLSQAFNGGSAIALAFRQGAALDVPRLTVCWSTEEDYYLLVVGDDDDVVCAAS